MHTPAPTCIWSSFQPPSGGHTGTIRQVLTVAPAGRKEAISKDKITGLLSLSQLLASASPPSSPWTSAMDFSRMFKKIIKQPTNECWALALIISWNSSTSLGKWVISHLQMRKLRLIQVRNLAQGHMVNYKWERELLVSTGVILVWIGEGGQDTGWW